MEQEQKPRQRSFIRELVPDWRPTRDQQLWTIRIIIVVVVLLGILTLIGLPFGITLWEWVKLLIVPAVIAGGGVWFNTQQRQRELEIAEERAQDEALQAYLDQMSQMLTDKARPLRRAQPGDNLSAVARARTLTILERVRDLQVIPGEVAQANVRPKDNVIYGRVGSFRKRAIVQFLYEGVLIQKNQPVISLQSADLSGAYLSAATLVNADLHQTVLVGADLSAARLNNADLRVANLLGADLRHAVLGGADLRNTALIGAYLLGATLSNANLQGADLTNADLRYASLDEANLSRANLSGAELSEAELPGADLSDANLSDANLSEAVLSEANLSATISLRVDLRGADLSDANLSGAWLENAHLENASLEDADLTGAVLIGAHLSEANLTGTDLRDAHLEEANYDPGAAAYLLSANLREANFHPGANLRYATGITEEQLEEQTKFLTGTTMPNGQKYEDWLKSKSSGDDGQNSGPS